MTYLANQIGENEKRPKSEVQELERIMRSTKLQCAQNGASRLVPQKWHRIPRIQEPRFLQVNLNKFLCYTSFIFL